MSEPAASSRWTKEAILARLRSAPVVESAHPPEEVLSRGYEEAASILTYFDPDSLQPVGSPPEDAAAARADLLARSVVLRDPVGHPRWSLKSDVRREALVRLVTGGRLADALHANRPTESDTFYQVLRSWQERRLTSLLSQTPDQLSAWLRLSEMLAGTAMPTPRDLPALPDSQEVRAVLEFQDLLLPFRRLIGDHFQGREKELRELREYVDALPAGSLYEQVRRVGQRLIKGEERPPLVVYGPGGVGKSSLLGKFILDHASQEGGLRPEGVRFPFAYLDFDRPGLLAEQPATLLVEILRQLAMQFSGPRLALNRLRDALARRLATPPNTGGRPGQDTERGPRSGSSTAPGRSAVPASWISAREGADHVADLASILADNGLAECPFLLALDTFEEVQYRSQDFIGELWLFLQEVQRHVPRLRAVVSGRAPVEGQPAELKLLGNLDDAAARGFLRLHGVTDPAAQLVASKTRGNPLCLKLAVDLLRREPQALKEIADIDARGPWLRRLTDEEIQGRLYRRVLFHLHGDERVRRLAHPGLVLRFITPELITEVLAGPCDVKIATPADAQALYNDLARETALVSQESGRLRHRPEVRHAMLELLRGDGRESHRIPAIHARAIAYYRQKQQAAPSDAYAHRAEEIYHRLALGESPIKVATLWRPEAGRYLEDAIDELPEGGRFFLAARLGRAVPSLDWRRADPLSWELYAERRSGELLALNLAEDALTILRERPDRSPDGGLFLLEAHALVRLQRWDEALHVVRAGLEGATQARRVRLLLLCGALEESLERPAAAAETLLTARGIALEIHDHVSRLEASTLLLALLRRRPRPLSERQGEKWIRQILIGPAVGDAGLARHEAFAEQPQLLRRFAGEVARFKPAVLRDVLRRVGVGRLPAEKLRMLPTVFTPWDAWLSDRLGEQRGILLRRAGLPQGSSVFSAWVACVNDLEEQAAISLLERLLRTEKMNQLVAERIGTLWHETDLTEQNDGPGKAQ